MAEDDEFWIRGKDDLGKEYVFDLTSYEKPNLIFELENLEIPNHAKTINFAALSFFEELQEKSFPTNRRNRKMHI